MTWELFYLICFIVGFVFSTLSFLTGTLHIHLPVKWHLRIGGGHAKGGISFLNSFSLMAFLAWFGAMGYLLTQHSSMWFGLIFVLATLVGLIGAAIVFLFLAKFLMKYDTDVDPADYEMTGVLGKVSSSIRGGGGTGEIVFEQVGIRRSCGARSEDGLPIAKGTDVVVTRYERGIAYVRTWDDIAGEAEAAASDSSK